MTGIYVGIQMVVTLKKPVVGKELFKVPGDFFGFPRVLA